MRRPVLPYANNKGADQPAHPRSLISTFVVHILDSIIPLVSISKISRLQLASVAEQAGLSLTWSETPKTGFLVTCLNYKQHILGMTILKIVQKLRINLISWIGPAHEIMVLFRPPLTHSSNRHVQPSSGARCLIDFSVGPFVYIHTSCVRTAKALARLRKCTGSPELLLVAYVVITKILWAGSINIFQMIKLLQMRLKMFPWNTLSFRSCIDSGAVRCFQT